MAKRKRRKGSKRRAPKRRTKRRLPPRGKNGRFKRRR